ncbi:MarR family transcriptional regulator [Sphingomonas sp.]|uniref:MarR family winged helix-turn-helix transcriptional regulator n=1 Tax=Sphingomonas sp. TaxID=28214 RepID=UPI002ED80FE9
MPDSLGFLLNDIARLMRKRFDERARRIGVTRAQWHTLSVLKRNEGCNQGMLADLLEVEPITVGRMIDRLEDAGLAERRRDPADRRVWRIHLTDKAQPILIELRAISDAMIDEVMEGVDPQDRTRMHAALVSLRTNLLADDDIKASESKEAANG